MTQTEQKMLRVDIVSDVVCPWCVIGYRQLAQALSQTGTPAEIHWHPFELNPGMAPEGQNLGTHIAEKYGSTPAQSQAARAQITALGAGLGFRFNFTPETRMLNTYKARQLIFWAGRTGRAQDLKLALFAAYFTDARDVSQPQVLATVAAAVGLDRSEALAIALEDRFAREVRAEEAFWTSRGITGVPALVFNQRYLVSGAQGVTAFEKVLTDLAEPAGD